MDLSSPGEYRGGQVARNRAARETRELLRTQLAAPARSLNFGQVVINVLWIQGVDVVEKCLERRF